MEPLIMDNPFKKAWGKFKTVALAKGYKIKVVGGYAFQRSLNPQSRLIRLNGAKNGMLQIYETGEGRYEIPFEEVKP